MHPPWHDVLTKQLPFGPTQEQPSALKARDELVPVEPRDKIKTDMTPATSRFFIASLSPDTATSPATQKEKAPSLKHRPGKKDVPQNSIVLTQKVRTK